MIYYTIVIPLFVLSILSILNRKMTKYSNYIGGVFVMILTVMASIRYKTGKDFDAYTNMYENITSLFDGAMGYEYIEPGFRYFVAFLKIFSDSPILFFGVMGTLTLAFLYFGLKKIEGVNIYIALFLYFMIFYISYTFNAMRQGVTMSVFVYSLSYIFERKFKKVLLLTILATSFHFSGILIILSYFVTKLRMKLVPYFLIGTVTSFLLYRLGFIGQLVDAIFGNKFHRYVEHYGSLTIIQLYIRTVLSFFFVLASSYIIRTDIFRKLVMMYLLGYYLYIILYDAGMMATRFNMFFRILEIVLFSMILYQSKYLANRVLFFILAVFLASITFYSDMTYDINIYKTIF